MSFYNFSAVDIDGFETSMDEFEDDVVLIVNTASKCGFTPQFEDLQKLHEKYADQGLSILGFPCNQFDDQNPENNTETKSFCAFNYGVSFKLFEKVDVNGSTAHPLFKYLKENADFQGMDLSHPTNKILSALLKDKYPDYLSGNEIRWNFTKFLIDRHGNVVERFEPTVEPMDLVPHIEKYLL
ncbi:glutathione peroxidase [Fusibacter tunisiensis]|uniref:Glutathione peroxidase n=1 Tax=Fusibacter tunisiensis TaxID=1008308 RepID=A0ABS2MQI0_9FIRM|nr:glutathione peroxidase [Fusibacter tunisiensis]MBM7561660.1 glutathione peroxidase [Fusibacter tunisiensis]